MPFAFAYIVLSAMAGLMVGATAGFAFACIVAANRNAGKIRYNPPRIQHRGHQSPWMPLGLFFIAYLMAGAIAPV